MATIMIDPRRTPGEQPGPEPAARFDGGNLDCGSGLLLQIRRHIDPLQPGEILEIRSTEPSVSEDLPAWCRLTGNVLVSLRHDRDAAAWTFLIARQGTGPTAREPRVASSHASSARPLATADPASGRLTSPDDRQPAIAALAVMGLGSWPRPPWLLEALHGRLEGRVSEPEYSALADRAVAQVVQAQLEAGVDVVTDGEQHRDSYASFVASRLENCQLIPIVDLLPYVEHPEAFARELQALDVPAQSVRHPAVFGRLARNPARPLAVHELIAVRKLTDRPVKIALPGPYLLTRTMWLECVADRAYSSREALAADVVEVLRAEIAALLEAGAALVQLDEPVLTEVVHGRPAGGNRSFMCGALGEKRPIAEELDFARSLLVSTLEPFPIERLAMHVCRGNWTRDVSAALSGDYAPLVPLFRSLPVGTLFLELCTSRAGEIDVLKGLPESVRIGVGVVDQKSGRVEPVEEIVFRARRAIALFGRDRVLLNPDCGFATFADSPITAFETASAKLANLVRASRLLREDFP